MIMATVTQRTTSYIILHNNDKLKTSKMKPPTETQVYFVILGASEHTPDIIASCNVSLSQHLLLIITQELHDG